jgi:hypothetical protein
MPARIAVLTTAAAQTAFDYFRPFIVSNVEGVPRMGDAEFIYNPEGGDFDGAVVWQSVAPLEGARTLRVPPTRTLLTILEPPDVLTLPARYTRQFAAALGPDPSVRCKRQFLQGGGHHWFVELTAEQALRQPLLDKPRLISAVVSSKADTAGHRRRLAFMRTLKEHFGERLDWFGRGIRDLGDRKLNALAEYRYHVVLENGAWPHYWTEKIADAFVANCLPFYWGDPRISETFDPQSHVPIEVDDVAGTIRLIEQAIAEDWWSQRQPALAGARRRVVEDLHPFNIWLNCLQSLPASSPREITVQPFDWFQFTLRERFALKWRRLLARKNSAL